MTARAREGPTGGRFSDGLAGGIRVDRRAALAICLAVIVLVSMVALPVAGAPPGDRGGPSDAGQGSGGGDGGDGGNAGGGSGNGGSGDDENAGGGSGNGGSGDGGNAAGGSGNGGASSNGGSSGAESDGSEAGNGGAAGPPDDAGNGGAAGPPDGAGNGGAAGPPDDAGNGGAGGPTVRVSSGASDGPGQPDGAPGRSSDGPPGQTDEPAPPSVVDVAVSGARPGDEVSIDVSPPEVENDPVAFDGVSVRLKRGGAFTMRVTNSVDRLPGSPAFEPEAAADDLGRVRLEHSITNEEVEDVSFDFRVSKSRLRAADTDPEEVALYRYADGRWTALETDVIGESPTHYRLSAASPGMSEFAIGAKRPDFRTYWAEAATDATEIGESIAVSGRVSNVGGADGVHEARLVVDGEVVERSKLTVAAGGTRQVNFDASIDRPGTYRVTVDGVTAGTVTVERPASASSTTVRESASWFFVRVLEVRRTVGVSSFSVLPGL